MGEVLGQALIINNTEDYQDFLDNVTTWIREWNNMGDLEFHYQQSDRVLSCLVICRQREEKK